MQRFAISTHSDPEADNLYYSCTYIKFSFAFPIKEIFFCEDSEHRVAKIFIKTWSIFDLLRLEEYFIPEENSPFRATILGRFFSAVEFSLEEHMLPEQLFSIARSLLVKLGKLPLRSGIPLEQDPCFSEIESTLYDCVKHYIHHLRHNFPHPRAKKTLQLQPVLDSDQQELLRLLELGQDILSCLRKGVNLKPSGHETFFLKEALPLAARYERRNLTNVWNNICLLVEYGAPLFGSSVYFHSIFSRLLDRAYLEEEYYLHACRAMKRAFKKSYSLLAVLDGSFHPSNPDELSYVEKYKLIYEGDKYEICAYQTRHLLFKDLIRLFLFLDNSQTIFFPILGKISDKYAMANWTLTGQRALQLEKQIPAQICHSLAEIPGERIDYTLIPGLSVSAPANVRITTSDKRQICIKTFSLAKVRNVTELIHPVFEIYYAAFKDRDTKEHLYEYFQKILDSNQEKGYLDIVMIEGKILAFNLGKFVSTRKENAPVLLYHGVLTAAGREITRYDGLMTWLNYWRCFLPVQYGIDIELLAVFESATIASYLQLIKLGIHFNPQYDILNDWIPVLKDAIYCTEKLYVEEEFVLEPGNICRVSDPFAQFNPKNTNPWQINRTTVTASRLSATVPDNTKKFDYIVFFKANKENYRKLYQKTALPVAKM